MNALCLVGGLLTIQTLSLAQLIGISFNSSAAQNELRSIDPWTGSSSLLNAFSFGTNGWRADTLVSDPSSGIICAISADNRLFRFDSVTGAFLGAPNTGSMIAAMDQGYAGLVGISYNASTSQNEFRTVDPASGTTTLLQSFTFGSGGWRPSTFVSDPTAGVAYAVSSDNRLYTFSLATGALLANPAMDSVVQALDLASSGLVGISYNASTGQQELRSIDGATGNSTLISAFTFSSGGWNAVFATDTGVAFAVSSDNTIYAFDLASGNLLATPNLGILVQGIAVPEPRPVWLLLGTCLAWPILFFRRRYRSKS
jgi:hypothetical protein